LAVDYFTNMSESTNTNNVVQPFLYYLVLDVEATCQENDRTFPNEIIEFPIVLINATTLMIEKQFHIYIKPTIRPTLTQFCTKLTGIQQEWVDKATPLEESLEAFHAWLTENKIYPGSFAFVTDGPWDLRNFLDAECKKKKS